MSAECARDRMFESDLNLYLWFCMNLNEFEGKQLDVTEHLRFG